MPGRRGGGGGRGARGRGRGRGRGGGRGRAARDDVSDTTSSAESSPASEPAEEEPELSFLESQLGHERTFDEPLVCPFCGDEFEEDDAIPEEEQLSRHYLLSSHIWARHPEEGGGPQTSADDTQQTNISSASSPPPAALAIAAPPADEDDAGVAGSQTVSQLFGTQTQYGKEEHAVDEPMLSVPLQAVKREQEDPAEEEEPAKKRGKPAPKASKPAAKPAKPAPKKAKKAEGGEAAPSSPALDQVVTIEVILMNRKPKQQHQLLRTHTTGDLLALVSQELGPPWAPSRLLSKGTEVRDPNAPIVSVMSSGSSHDIVHYVQRLTGPQPSEEERVENGKAAEETAGRVMRELAEVRRQAGIPTPVAVPAAGAAPPPAAAVPAAPTAPAAAPAPGSPAGAASPPGAAGGAAGVPQGAVPMQPYGLPPRQPLLLITESPAGAASPPSAAEGAAGVPQGAAPVQPSGVPQQQPHPVQADRALPVRNTVVQRIAAALDAEKGEAATDIAKQIEQGVWEMHGRVLAQPYRSHIKRLFEIKNTQVPEALLAGRLTVEACIALQSFSDFTG